MLHVYIWLYSQDKKEDIYIVIEKDVEKRFNTSTY